LLNFFLGSPRPVLQTKLCSRTGKALRLV
jgi:hypothetical protein